MMAMPAPCPPPLVPLGSVDGGPAVSALAGLGMLMFHGEVFLSEVDVFQMKKGPEGGLHRAEDHET
jgi:RNA polymerase II C-terminal domain phosphatase-like 1/2